MDLWSTYADCFKSEGLDVIRVDAHRLIRAVHTIKSTEDPIPDESNKPVPLEPTTHLSVDPGAMSAACALRAGHPRGKGDAYTLHESCSTRSSFTLGNHALSMTRPKPD
jgi:hypothetical protein